MSIELIMPSNHLVLCHPLLLLPSIFPSFKPSWVTEWVKSFSCIWLSEIPGTVAHPAPLFMGFSRQEYWSGLPYVSPGDLSDPGIEPRFSNLYADSLPSKPPRKSTYLRNNYCWPWKYICDGMHLLGCIKGWGFFLSAISANCLWCLSHSGLMFI